MFKKIFNWLQDHYHLLFKSAADNHLRIQNILKNSDGSYQLTVRFGSFTELKNYQKKLRRVTVSLSSAIAMVLVAFVISPYILHPNKSAASTFLWNQTNWGTHATNPDTTVAVGGTNNTNWAQYNTNSNITASASGVTLPAPSIASTGDSSYSTATTGFYTSGGILKLLKPVGAGCGTAGDSVGNGECQNNQCKANECFPTLQDGYHLDSSGADINTTTPNNLTGFGGTGTLLSEGWESGNFSTWTGTSGPAISNTVSHSGTYSLYLSSSATVAKNFTLSANGTVSVSYWYRDSQSSSFSITADLDSSTTAQIACNSTVNSWVNCTWSGNVAAGTHKLTLRTSDSANYDDITVTGPVAFAGWDTTNKKVGTAAANITSGTSLQPGSPITLGSQWTVAAWMGMDTGTDGNYYVLSDGGSNVALAFSRNTSSSVSYYAPAIIVGGTLYGTSSVTSTPSGTANSTWFHVVIVGSAGSTTIYVNGVSRATMAQQVTGNMTYIGNSSDGTHPAGHLDELLVFNRALSASEVSALYSSLMPWQ